MTRRPEVDLVIRRAELDGHIVDVTTDAGLIASITPARNTPAPARTVIDAAGGAVLPGLHDHHVHLLAAAAALESVRCGPPDVRTAEQLAARLQAAAGATAAGDWVRAVDYHESVAGPIDRHWLDRLNLARPVRIQHRSGAMWILNSLAVSAAGIGAASPPCVERAGDGEPTGRIVRGDQWLRERVPLRPLPLRDLGLRLAAFGVTAVTDMTPTSSSAEVELLARAVADGDLRFRVSVTGDASLPRSAAPTIPRGPVKIVIGDDDLPALSALVDRIAEAHGAGRAVAAHCVTREAIILALAAWEEAGAGRGDRIEHGAVIPPELFGVLGSLGLTIVTQPIFVRQRGDDYLDAVDAEDVPDLWRCGSLLDAGIPVAFGTDMPFGDDDPWRSVDAATERLTADRRVLGPAERIAPRRALDLFFGSRDTPARPRRVEPGTVADLCVLDRPLHEQLAGITSSAVTATIVDGAVVYARP